MSVTMIIKKDLEQLLFLMSQKVAEEKVSYGWDLQPIDCLQINFSYLETSLCSTPPPPPLPPNNNLLSPAHKHKPTCLGGSQDIIKSYMKYRLSKFPVVTN